MNSDSLFENSQLVVSYELLQFLRWVVTTEPESLQVLMRQSLEAKSGHGSSSSSLLEDTPSHEELQRSVIDFFDLLENKLQEIIHAVDHDAKPAEQALSPTVNSIDSSLCDENTVAVSIAHATSQLTQLSMGTPQHAKEMLYKELLKNWRPRNKHLLH
jgi:hypothetical protein